MINKIYVITVLERMEFNEISNIDYDVDFGCTDSPGWFSSLEEAKRVVENNICDLNETCYDYAIIEEVDEGIYNFAKFRWIYKFDKDTGTYKEISEPPCLKHLSNFSIG